MSFIGRPRTYALDDFDCSGVTEDFVGVIAGAAGPISMSVSRFDNGGICVVGMYLDSDKWLDDLKEENNSEYSLFFGKTRYATTVTDSSGKRAVGTEMPAEVAEVVIDRG